MIEILIAIIAFTTLATWGADIDKYNSVFHSILCPIASMLGFISFFLYAILGWSYVAAGYKADIINKEFGTEYSQSQVFYASDVIDEIQNLKRERIEINGDLMAEKKP